MKKIILKMFKKKVDNYSNRDTVNNLKRLAYDIDF